MTREEKIRLTADKYCRDEYTRLGFIADAEWADAHPHWISVDEELPKDWEGEKQFVLYTEPYNEDYSYMGRLRIGEYDGDESKLYLVANNRWIIYGKNDGNTKVTHWMPLPQPPTCSEKPNNCEKGGEE